MKKTILALALLCLGPALLRADSASDAKTALGDLQTCNSQVQQVQSSTSISNISVNSIQQYAGQLQGMQGYFQSVANDLSRLNLPALSSLQSVALDLQVKLLRALQEKEVRPVGATHRVPIKARIVAATNRDLAAMVEKGSFRKDLFYRLNVVNLRLPPLRDRREDIPLLAAHFLDRACHGHGVKFTFSDEVLHAMMRHDWPGNVRELENAVERACALCSGRVLELGNLPTQLQQQGLQALRIAAAATEPAGEVGAPHVKTLADLEREAILGAIRTLHGDKLQAARLLGIGKTTLYRKLKEYGIAGPL